jgi:hypothetical protein
MWYILLLDVGIILLWFVDLYSFFNIIFYISDFFYLLGVVFDNCWWAMPLDCIRSTKNWFLDCFIVDYLFFGLIYFCSGLLLYGLSVLMCY